MCVILCPAQLCIESLHLILLEALDILLSVTLQPVSRLLWLFALLWLGEALKNEAPSHGYIINILYLIIMPMRRVVSRHYLVLLTLRTPLNYCITHNLPLTIQRQFDNLIGAPLCLK